MLFLDVFYSSALPVFVMIGVGVLADQLFDLDLNTLSKLGFYIFIPALLFVVIFDSDLQAGDILQIGAFLLTHSAVMLVLGGLLFSLKPLRARRSSLLMGALFFNSANYGLPLLSMAFGEEVVSIIAVVITVQMLLFFTLGFALAGSDATNLLESATQFLRYPIIYVIILAFVLRELGVMLPVPIDMPVRRLADAYIPLALVMLGIQLSRSQIAADGKTVLAAVITRLALAPLAAAAVALLLFQFDSLTKHVLIAVMGMPVAVNVYVISIELENDPAFASRMVFWSTVLSIISVPILLVIVRSL